MADRAPPGTLSNPLYPLKTVGPEALTSARYTSTHSVDLPLSPEQVFKLWAEADTWPQWLPGMKGFPWDEPEGPREEGMGRSVYLADGTVMHEIFHTWDPPREMAFSIDAASNPLFSAFAERWVLTPTPGGCRLDWTLAYTPERFLRWLHPWVRPMVNLGLKAALKRFANFCQRLRLGLDARG